MKDRTPEQLKGQVRNFAAKRNLQSQEVLQMFFFERVLERLSKSQYKDNFILKGGLLISSMLGVAERTTMDMDTTVTGIDMDEQEIETIIRRNLGTTRARDFYDLYMFYNMYRPTIDPEILQCAVVKTAKKRESLLLLAEWKEIIEDMKEDVVLGELWKNYCMNNAYATHIDYESVMEVTEKIGEMIDVFTS